VFLCASPPLIACSICLSDAADLLVELVVIMKILLKLKPMLQAVLHLHMLKRPALYVPCAPFYINHDINHIMLESDVCKLSLPVLPPNVLARNFLIN
jgi:hypothetical protein